MESQLISLQHIHLLLLIIVANAAPVIISRLLKHRLNHPIDLGKKLTDGYPLLGRSKTWRGLLGALIFTSISAWLLSHSPLIGTYIAIAAMAGDLISSFIKRRLKKASSSQMLLLDGIPECALPLMIMVDTFNLQWFSFIALIVLFVSIELSLSKLLHKLHL